MRWILFVLAALLCPAASAQNCPNGRCQLPSVLVQTIEATAQDHADTLAANGGFYHARVRCREGLGFSRVSADDACRRSCFWGRYRVREIGTAWCPRRGGWVAVVRYQ